MFFRKKVNVVPQHLTDAEEREVSNISRETGLCFFEAKEEYFKRHGEQRRLGDY